MEQTERCTINWDTSILQHILLRQPKKSCTDVGLPAMFSPICAQGGGSLGHPMADKEPAEPALLGTPTAPSTPTPSHKVLVLRLTPKALIKEESRSFPTLSGATKKSSPSPSPSPGHRKERKQSHVGNSSRKPEFGLCDLRPDNILPGMAARNRPRGPPQKEDTADAHEERNMWNQIVSDLRRLKAINAKAKEVTDQIIKMEAEMGSCR